MPEETTAAEDRFDTVLHRAAGGRTVSLRVLHAVSDYEREVRVLATGDYMKAFLHLVRRAEDHRVRPDELRELLQSSGVKSGIDEVGLEIFCDLVNGAQTLPGPFELARGEPPRPGRNGGLEFHVRTASEEAEYETDAEGNVDFRALNLIENVVSGQHIATFRPPSKGKNGRNILGQTVPATDGRPRPIRLGAGVKANEDQTEIYAAAEGLVRFDEGTISIKSTYEVPGDVDLSVGNVDFVGEVVVKGSVGDEFRVRGRRGVLIHGSVGASLIESDGDVTILGGVAGKQKGRILVGGEFRARFIHNVEIEARGDVEVGKEMVNCTIRTTGRVRLPNGTLVGGEVRAFRGIEVRDLGSDLGVATLVVSGIDWTTEETVSELEQAIQKIEEDIRQVSTDLQPLLGEKARLHSLTPPQKTMLREFLQYLRRRKEDLAESQDARESIIHQGRQDRVCQVNVNGILYPGVMVRFPFLRLAIKDEYKGPLSIVEDTRTERIRLVAHKPLPDGRGSSRKGAPAPDAAGAARPPRTARSGGPPPG